MQLPNTVHDYSDFFRSGFRAFTSRGSGRAASSRNYLYGSPDATPNTPNTSPLTPRTTFAAAPKRRSRPVSMAMESPSTEKARRRWSSFLSLPSHLFDRKSATTSPDKRSTISSTSSISSYAFDTGDSLLGVWITSSGPRTRSEQNGSSDDLAFPFDPFCSSPDAKSTFIDFSQDDPAVSDHHPKRDSFISFASSSGRSSLPITRRERPSSSSIQTRPPLSSRRSSVQSHPYNCHPYLIGQEKPDPSWVVEDGNDLISSEVTEVDREDRDAPAKIDWRQFHVDILTDDM